SAIGVRQVRNENLQFCQRYIRYQRSLAETFRCYFYTQSVIKIASNGAVVTFDPNSSRAADYGHPVQDRPRHCQRSYGRTVWIPELFHCTHAASSTRNKRTCAARRTRT